MADLKRSAAVKSELEGIIAYGRAKLVGQAAPLPPLQSTRGFTFVATTAWQTAIATQALIHLPFAEAGSIAEAQSQQVLLNELQARAEAEWFELAAYDDPRPVPSDEIRPALEKVTIAYAYLISVKAGERQLAGAYDRALLASGGTAPK